MKKSILIALAALLTIALFVGSAAAWGGSGTSSDPYQISSDADLQTWNNNAATYNTSYFAITADFTPATTISKFAGNLNGNNHTLSNMTTPLFDNLGGSVSNLTFKDCLVSGEGVLANTSSAAVTNVTAENSFVSGKASGGLVGTASGTFTDCTVNYVTVKGTEYAGGIAGNGNTTVTRCHVLNSDILAPTAYGICSDVDHYPALKYTITWDESSSTSENISWADDAAGLTEEQRNELIKDHSHFAVVKWNGTEPEVNYYLYRDNLNYRATDETCKTSSGVASDLTGTDGDVMLLYDQVWWTTSKVENNWYITFTWDEKATDDSWVSPHTYGDSLSNTSLAKYVGLGVFEGYVQNSQLRSISISKQPTCSTSQNNFYNAAVYNRNWQYNNMLPMTYAWYVIQLYFVKGNRDTQTAYGYGYVGASNRVEINWNWSATKAWNFRYTSQIAPVTALGIQNAWGNCCKYMGETRYDNKVYRFSVLGGKDHYNIESGYANTWKSITVQKTFNGENIYTITGIPEYPFFGDNFFTGDTDYTRHYADSATQTSTNSHSVVVGGRYDDGFKAGALYVKANVPISSSFNTYGSRLHVVII